MWRCLAWGIVGFLANSGVSLRALAQAPELAPSDAGIEAEMTIDAVDAGLPPEAAPPLAVPAVQTKPKSVERGKPPMLVPLVIVAPLDAMQVDGAANFVDEEELTTFEHDDVQRVLNRVPGVYTRSEDGYGLRPNIGLRGVSSDRSSKLTLMEDGILFGPAPYSAPAAYYFPLTTRMTGIEVFKGPAAIRYGPNTVGGAINLLSKPIPERSQGQLDLAGGLYRYGKGHGSWGMSGRRWGILLEGVHLRSDGFQHIDGVAHGGNTGFAKNEAMLKLQVHSEASAELFQSLEGKFGYADETSFQSYVGLSDSDFAADSRRRYAGTQRDRMDLRRGQVELTHLLRWRERLKMRTTAYRHDLTRTWLRLDQFRNGPPLKSVVENPTSGATAIFYDVLSGAQNSETPDQSLLLADNHRVFVSQGLASVLDVELRHGIIAQNIQFGARLHYDRIRRDHTLHGTQMLNQTLVDDGSTPQQAADNTASTLATALHALDEVTLWDRWHVTPGLRIELIDSRFTDRLPGDERSDSQFRAVVIPGVGASFDALPWLSVVAGVHRGFSPVAPGQPASVKPELSINYEAGARLARGGWRASSIGFFNDYSNLSAICTASSCGDEAAIDAQFNAGKVFIYGAEAELGYEWRGPWGLAFGGGVNYTLTLSRFRSNFVSENPLFGSVEAGDQLPYVPLHQGSLSLSVGRGAWRSKIAALFLGEMLDTAGRFDDAQVLRTDRAVVVDLATSYALTPRDEIYLNFDNLFNARYIASRRPYGARPGLPLSFFAGYRHAFGAL